MVRLLVDPKRHEMTTVIGEAEAMLRFGTVLLVGVGTGRSWKVESVEAVLKAVTELYTGEGVKK